MGRFFRHKELRTKDAALHVALGGKAGYDEDDYHWWGSGAGGLPHYATQIADAYEAEGKLTPEQFKRYLDALILSTGADKETEFYDGHLQTYGSIRLIMRATAEQRVDAMLIALTPAAQPQGDPQ